MKYLVLIAVVVVVYMLWRSQRRQEKAERQQRAAAAPPPAAPAALPQDMVRCDVCALHLPRSEALAGPDGRLYCCPEHRAGA